MTRYSHLTNDELVQQLSMMDNLTETEHELLDRLVIALDELACMQDEVKAIREAGFGVHD